MGDCGSLESNSDIRLHIKFMFKEIQKLYEANLIKDFAIFRSSLEQVYQRLCYDTDEDGGRFIG